jgi:hypothetical protein
MVELTPIEAKLLRLMLDSAAEPGEVSTSSLKFAESLRRRSVSAYEIEQAISAAVGNGTGLQPNYGLCVMPFGRTKGQRFMDLSPYELRSARRWAVHTPDLARKFAEFVHDVDEFLRQQ